MSGLQLLAVLGIIITAGLSVRLLFWAVRGLMRYSHAETRYLGYLGGHFLLAICVVTVAIMTRSGVVAVSSIFVLISGMTGLTNAIIEAVIKRRKKKVIVG